MEPYIALKDIHKFFPGVHALKGVSLSVLPGEVHALIGENGAGKSTLIKVMAGFHTPERGKCYIDGQETKIDSPAKSIALGIGVVYQELNIVDSLNVAENIFFGRLPKGKLGRVDWKKLYTQTQEVLDRLGLDISPKIKAGFLSTAQKQMVEIARCTSMNPKVLIMDEPTSSLAPAEVESMFKIIRKLQEQQVGVVYISHKLDEVLAISDRVTVLRDGAFVECLQTKDATQEQLIALMVGREHSELFHHTPRFREELALEVENFSTDKVKNISFHVRKGEIVGFSGLMGAGRSELAKGIIGADGRESGSVRVYGQEVKKNSVLAASEAGMGFVPEERKLEGIFPNGTVMQNITVASLDQCSKGGVLQRKMELEASEAQREAIHIKTPSVHQLIVNLSGGNQQKAILARWLVKNNLKVLVIDEPTRGIDVGAKAEIYAILEKLADAGLAVVIMSSEMQEILNVCDRIYVMHRGRIVSEYNIEDATQEKLLTSALG